MDKNKSIAVNITETDYVRKTQEEVLVATAKKVLKKHFSNVPVDNGQQAVLVVREAFKKGDSKNPLFFGTLATVKAEVSFGDGVKFEFSRPVFDNIFLGNKCDVKPGKSAVFTIVENGKKGYRAEKSSVSAVAAKQIDAVTFGRVCQQIVDNIDFTKVTFNEDVVLCGNTVSKSQVFANGNRRNLQIEFEKPIEFSEADLVSALQIVNGQVFLSRKIAVVLWEV